VTFGMIVTLSVRPGRMDQVLEILGSLMPRVRDEEGCLAFSVLTSPATPDTVWLYESYSSESYHDDVHESFPEVKNVLARLPEHLTAPWVVHQGELALSR
jgi:quinol monooxygenase YgiN